MRIKILVLVLSVGTVMICQAYDQWMGHQSQTTLAAAAD